MHFVASLHHTQQQDSSLAALSLHYSSLYPLLCTIILLVISSSSFHCASIGYILFPPLINASLQAFHNYFTLSNNPFHSHCPFSQHFSLYFYFVTFNTLILFLNSCLVFAHDYLLVPLSPTVRSEHGYKDSCVRLKSGSRCVVCVGAPRLGPHRYGGKGRNTDDAGKCLPDVQGLLHPQRETQRHLSILRRICYTILMGEAAFLERVNFN